MDPNACLDEMLELSRRLGDDACQSDAQHEIDEDDALRLAELVLSLDGWLSVRGFLPERWGRKRP